MSKTKDWAASLGIATDADLPPVPDFSRPYARTAQEIAIRAVVIQGVVAAAYGVEAGPITEWFHEQAIWDAVTPRERDFLANLQRAEQQINRLRWKQEAEWTLLWTIGRVESIGLPTHCCNTRRLVDEIIPALRSDIRPFVNESQLRSPGALLAEDDRTYDLWCNALAVQKRAEPLPDDLNLGVLYERRYAFEWISGNEEWDDVTCDS